MKAKKLSQRIASIRAASNFEHKLIDEIFSIMSLKRKAEFDYRANLDLVLKEIHKYLSTDNGFLTEIVKAFQSYVMVVYQNQTALIEGYDNEILSFLGQAKNSRLEQDIVKKVESVDKQIEACKEQIKQYKKLIRQNEEDLTLISSEAVFRGKMKELNEPDRKNLGQKYSDLQNLKRLNQQSLQQHVDGMMDLTMIHNQTVEQLNDYETTYLDQKASDVYDNFMRTFVLEVSFIRSMQFDVTSILQRVNEKKDENKRIAFENLQRRMGQEKSIKESLWSTYKKWANQEMGIEINEHYIAPRIRDKWMRVCEYYNHTQV